MKNLLKKAISYIAPSLEIDKSKSQDSAREFVAYIFSAPATKVTLHEVKTKMKELQKWGFFQPSMMEWVKSKVQILEALIRTRAVDTILGGVQLDPWHTFEDEAACSQPDSPTRMGLQEQWTSSDDESNEAHETCARLDQKKAKISGKEYYVKLNINVQNEQLATVLAHLINGKSYVADSVVFRRPIGDEPIQIQKKVNGAPFTREAARKLTTKFLKCAIFHLLAGVWDMHSENMNAEIKTLDCKCAFIEKAQLFSWISDTEFGLPFNTCYLGLPEMKTPLSKDIKSWLRLAIENIVKVIENDALFNKLPAFEDKLSGVVDRAKKMGYILDQDSNGLTGHLTIMSLLHGVFPGVGMIVEKLCHVSGCNPPGDMFAALNVPFQHLITQLLASYNWSLDEVNNMLNLSFNTQGIVYISSDQLQSNSTYLMIEKGQTPPRENLEELAHIIKGIVYPYIIH